MEIPEERIIQSMQNVYNKKKSDIAFGILLACLFGLLGAMIWALITRLTGYYIGAIAVLLGVLVSQGFVVAGRSHHIVGGLIAAVIAIMSLLFGNILGMLLVVANAFQVSIIELLPIIDVNGLFATLADSFQLSDLVFYVIAVLIAFNRSYVKRDVAIELYESNFMPENEISITAVNTDTVKIPITYITPVIDEGTRENHQER